MKKLIFLLLTIQLAVTTQGQLKQTIKGKVVDKESKTPLIGANVVEISSSPLNVTTTDGDGNFRLTVPVGRISIKASYVGYEDIQVSQIQVIAGKETYLTLELRENIAALDEIVVKANKDKTQPLNSMASVSARMISTEDAGRYAAGYFDPARMVSSFAGVSAMEGDGKNDIVIRGNSPRGLQWKLEGIEIPSPNHFPDGQGDSGGAFCIITSDVLSNSDFYTGAFPSEYGNALSGILDLNLRKGNSDKHEFGFLAGVVGSEASLEGPIGSLKGSSYLINYRYANFSLLNKAGLVDMGVNRIAPVFQDLALNINIPTEKSGTFSLFGVGGMSNTGKFGIQDSLRWQQDNDLRNDETEYHKMGVLGLKHTITLENKKTFIKSIIAATDIYDKWDQGFLWHNYQRIQYYYSKYSFPTYKASVTINHKFNAVHTFRIGFDYSQLGFNMFERQSYFNQTSIVRNDKSGSSGLAEAFFQWKYRLTENLEINSGAHSLLFLLNNHYSIEPRVGLKWNINDKSSINYGFGIHSRVEAISAYYAMIPMPDGTMEPANKNVNFTRAVHNVLGYDWTINKNLRLKAEIYYQYLYDIPIINDSTSTESAINWQFGIPTLALANKGKAYNKGLEFTLEKFYSNDYYFLITASLFDSKYRAGDGKLYNTYFNGNYVTNWLAGKDFKLGKTKQNIFGFNVKTLVRGGFRYTPVDLSKSENDAYYIYSESFSKQMPYYLRFDLGLKYRRNNSGYSWIISLDVQNLTDRKNVLGYSYYGSRGNNGMRPDEALGIVPILNFKVEF